MNISTIKPSPRVSTVTKNNTSCHNNAVFIVSCSKGSLFVFKTFQITTSLGSTAPLRPLRKLSQSTRNGYDASWRCGKSRVCLKSSGNTAKWDCKSTRRISGQTWDPLRSSGREGNPQTPQEAVFLTFILTNWIPFISEALNDTAILKNNKKRFTI